MVPQRRNMTRRKPVPRLTPDTTTPPPLPVKMLPVNKEVPPVPFDPDWSETIQNASDHDKRHAVYLPEPDLLPPALPPKHDELLTSSRPESLNETLVDLQEVHEGSTPVLSPQSGPLPAQSLNTPPQPTPDVRRRASQKALSQDYRPPTPPIPAQHPKLRSGRHSKASSQDCQIQTVYTGPVSAERRESAPPSSTLASWYSRPGHAVSMTADSLESRNNDLSSDGFPLQRAGVPLSPHDRRQSACSTSAGNRSTTGRSQFTCHSMCFGMWNALKRFGLHLRVKVGQNNKF